MGDEANLHGARAFVFEGAVLDGDEDDGIKLVARIHGGSPDREGGLPHAARPRDEGTPGALFRAEGIMNLREFLFTTMEVIEAGEVVGDGCGDAAGSARKGGWWCRWLGSGRWVDRGRGGLGASLLEPLKKESGAGGSVFADEVDVGASAEDAIRFEIGDSDTDKDALFSGGIVGKCGLPFGLAET